MTRGDIFASAIYAQAHLDEALPLDRLAALADLSPHHFHRVFVEETGETPAAYVQRLRVEKAAFRLFLHDEPIVAIALDCGFANHETLTRAFKRHFGVTPRDYRQQRRLALAANRSDPKAALASESFQLSSTAIVQLQPVPIAFMRAIGPYEDVDPGLWAQLQDWAHECSLPEEHLLIGIGHDAPGVTAPDKLRFDACITIPEGVASDREAIHVGALPALQCAVTSHVGAYASLPSAYPEIYGKAASMPGCELVGLPAIEIYRDTHVDVLRPISTTDIYLPIRRSK